MKIKQNKCSRTIGSSNDNTMGECSYEKVSRVRFEKVTIRHYNRTIGDNPACSGVPVSLDWTYSPIHETLPVSEYEKRRSNPPRRQTEMLLSPYIRYKMLLNDLQIPLSTITEVTSELTSIRQSRDRTAKKFLKRSNHERLKLVYRSLTKIFGLKKGRCKADKIKARKNENSLIWIINEPFEQIPSVFIGDDKIPSSAILNDEEDSVSMERGFDQKIREDRLHSFFAGGNDEIPVLNEHPLRSLVYNKELSSKQI